MRTAAIVIFAAAAALRLMPCCAAEAATAADAGAAPSAASAPDALDVAKAALRDGLWGVARRSAAKAGGDEAALVAAEALAREGRWKELLDALSSSHAPSGGLAAFYRAIALERLGRAKDALEELDALEASGSAEVALDRPAAALRAGIALDSGDAAKALAIAEKGGLADGDAAERLLLAEALRANSKDEDARKTWRSVLELEGAPDEALAAAACALGGADDLRLAMEKIGNPAPRRLVGLRLGAALLRKPETFTEGTGLVARIASAYPQTPGAMEAAVACADTLLGRGDAAAAENAYRTALDTWPEAAVASVHEGLGLSLAKLSRTEESLDAFARAGEAADDAETKARALLEAGDALAAAGRRDESAAKYRKAVEKYPGTAAAARLKDAVALHDLETKAAKLYAEYRFADAMAAYAEIAAKDPTRKPRTDYFRMLCLYGMVKDAEAAKIAKALSAKSPDAEVRAEATLWLAKFLGNSGRWSDAADLFAQYATNLAPASARAPAALAQAARAALSAGDFAAAEGLAARLAREHPAAPETAAAQLVRGEALVELSRLDEAVVILEAAASAPGCAPDARLRAGVLKADALFVLGAGNPARYAEALECYRSLLLGAGLAPDARMQIEFKIARTLEKQGKIDEAADGYYGGVVAPYVEARARGGSFSDETRAAFASAVFRLASEFESRGETAKAAAMLGRLASGEPGPAAKEARRRLARLREKGLSR